MTYKFVDHYTYEPNYTFGENGTHFEFMLSNTDIILRQESLLYSFNSFVAETGGILGKFFFFIKLLKKKDNQGKFYDNTGLFIGFSFLFLWDELCRIFVIFIGNPIMRMSNQRKDKTRHE